jgi:hypothetical protein
MLRLTRRPFATLLIALGLLFVKVTGANAQFTAGQVLTAAQLNTAFANTLSIAGGTLTGPLTVPTLTVTGTVSLSNSLPVASGGTGATSASGVSLDNITGFSGTGLLNRTGAGAYSFVPLTSILQASNNLSDLGSASTARANLGLGSIATQAASAVAFTGGAINGTSIGATTSSTGAFTTLSASSAATLNTLSSSGATITGGSINGTPIGGTAAAALTSTTLTATSAVAMPNRTIAASVSAAATDYVVLVNATAGAVTYTLPAASSSANRILIVQKIDASTNAITIVRAGSDTINGATSQTISSQYGALMLQSNGTSWTVLGNTIATLG